MNFDLDSIIVENSVKILISILISILITWKSIPVIINLCKLIGLMESPIKRSSHKNPIPTFGGVGIFAGLVIGYMIWNFYDEGHLMHRVFAGITLLFFLGLKDDIYGVNALKKLGSQIIAAALVVIGSDLRINNFFNTFGISEIPYIISILFTIVLFVAIINAFNLIDGIDGLAGGIGAISSGGFGLWFALNEYWSLACLGFCLAACLVAFLRFNFSETNKIFMGDTGSLIVGFTVAVLAIKFVVLNISINYASGSRLINAPVVALTLLSIPIFDTLRVFGLRIIKGKSPFAADRLHMHHLMIDIGLSHILTSIILSAITVFATLTVYFLRIFYSNTQLSLGVLGMFGVYLFVGFLLEVKRLKIFKEKARNAVATVKTSQQPNITTSFKRNFNPN